MSVAPAVPALSHHPVAGAYSRLAEVLPAVRLLEGAPRSGGGWVKAGELASGGPALDAFLAAEEAEVVGNYGRPARPDVTAGFGLHRYAWSACLLITVPWFLLRRVPRLPAGEVAFHRAQGRMTARVREFACLPDDPAAGLPGARVVSGEDALRAEVRGALAEHLEPVLEGFRPRMRRGPRAMWGMATDEIVESLWYAGHLLGEERRAIAELEALLPGATKPFVGAPSFRELTGPAGETLSTRDRASCCMFYTLRPEDTCVTCPRTCDAERVARLSGA
ncbi:MULTISPECIES: (2Fe-2S)-binding protein [Streptomyces]|uniref:Iron-sulfur protein n=2 Tax=Streptomyces TaxID=1883 RepID=A0A3R7IP26_9ACTN|nr:MULTISPECIES: (2Fe-2S)-binding protein [Streptomyces]KNE79723.1 iron-sulfur protein [Streptomyces fradiae]OFA37808.1 iron-sulfur protein [Streptomyces fradiae]PQM19438.1 iron-sulfur protein [Streptomyces xinghaiensis]RKM92935.1 iron-sulfur protein [Streptomyces xinghaiensis]RNC69139.1 iron-sulfur protein [Streptomyces xinghaiensis]